MDLRSQEYFDSILKKEPEALNQDEKTFLWARRGYLKKSQLEEYEDVIKPKEVKPKNQTSEKETVKEDVKEK